MRIILALLFILAAATAADEATDEGPHEATLTPEQTLAALVFTDVQSIDVTTLIMVEMPSDRPDGRHSLTRAAAHPSLKVAKDSNKELLAMIASAGNYHFNGTTMCFNPGMRIRIHEKQRIVTLTICLECAKVMVTTNKDSYFFADFSPAGLLAYKAVYLDFIVLKKGQKRE